MKYSKKHILPTREHRRRTEKSSSVNPEYEECPITDTAQSKTLYLLPSPIGNKRDITLRTLDILRSVSIIACENLKRANIVLSHYGITGAKRIVCQSSNEVASATGICQLLQNKNSIAYISDAGTPGINDPGNKLITSVRDAGFCIEALPGASALTLIISLSPFPCKPFIFLGFLSAKTSKRERELKYWLDIPSCIVLFESPFRIESTLLLLNKLAPKREVFLGREMTKKNAQFLQGEPDSIARELKKKSIIRGEFSLIINAPKR